MLVRPNDPTTEEELHSNLLLSSARGHQQRAVAFARAAEPERGIGPELSTHLLLKWGYGHRAAHDVNQEAMQVVKSWGSRRLS